jgi:hypothetical protein
MDQPQGRQRKKKKSLGLFNGFISALKDGSRVVFHCKGLLERTRQGAIIIKQAKNHVLIFF